MNYQNRSMSFCLPKTKQIKHISGRQTKPMQNLIRAPNHHITLLWKGMCLLSFRQQRFFVSPSEETINFLRSFSEIMTYRFSS